jgi:hypothetical protein
MLWSDTDRIYDTPKQFRYSLKQHDPDGNEHVFVVCSDDWDDVVRGISRVRTFIKATRARDPIPGAPEQVDAAYDDPWLSLKQLADRLPAFSYTQIQWRLAHREQNGLTKYVRRVGRRLYIRESGFNEWLDQQTEK